MSGGNTLAGLIYKMRNRVVRSHNKHSYTLHWAPTYAGAAGMTVENPGQDHVGWQGQQTQGCTRSCQQAAPPVLRPATLLPHRLKHLLHHHAWPVDLGGPLYLGTIYWKLRLLTSWVVCVQCLHHFCDKTAWNRRRNRCECRFRNFCLRKETKPAVVLRNKS